MPIDQSGVGHGTESTALRTTQAFFARYDDHDIDGMVELFDADAIVDYVPMGSRGSLDGVGVPVWKGLIDAFPDLDVKIGRIHATADGRHSFAEVTIEGTQDKEAFGIENQGRRYSLRHLFTLDFGGLGAITEMTCFFDVAGWYRQLGRTHLDEG